MKIVNQMGCIFFGDKTFVGIINEKPGHELVSLKNALLIDEDEYDYCCTLIGDITFFLNMCGTSVLDKKSELYEVYQDYFNEEVEEED